MANMTFSEIYTAFYSLYRGDADVPASTDDEYTVGMRLANEAITRWANFDSTYWKELFTTLQGTTQVSPALVKTITTGDTTYTAPTAFREAGGSVRVLDSNGNTVQTYPIIEPHEKQFKGDSSTYAYFDGNPKDGYVMHLNPAPTANLNGLNFDYDYYKYPTLFTTGTDVTEVPNPYFIVHRMLAQQFRVSRNPYYSSALRDSEDSLKIMQTDNNSGTWSNPWTQSDNSGSSWGW